MAGAAAGFARTINGHHHEHLFRWSRRGASSADYLAGALLRFSVNVPDRLYPDGSVAVRHRQRVPVAGQYRRDNSSSGINYPWATAKPATWHQLTTIVQVRPDKDIFPVRANYGEDDQHTIGLNFLSCGIPVLVHAGGLHRGEAIDRQDAQVLRAITFETGEPQSRLRPIKIAGNPNYRIDPYRDDFYRRVIDLRATVKTRLKNAAFVRTRRFGQRAADPQNSGQRDELR